MKIFCLESKWDDNNVLSVQPILDILRMNYGIQYNIFRWISFADLQHFCSFITDDDVVYIASHGDKGKLKSAEEVQNTLPLEGLAELFSGNLKNKILHLASCSTVDVHYKTLDKFVRDTGLKAVSGYTTYTDWVTSAAMDLVYLDLLCTTNLTKRAVETFFDKYNDLIVATGFSLSLKGKRI